MSNSCFHFKQFDVYHDRCAMKVGTDGVLLGAWVNPLQNGRILDVGTGTGLIALILAQRTDALIDAVEITAEGAEQASLNVANSPWSERISVIRADYNYYTSDQSYGLIISNPPFFRNSLKAPSKGRKLARHDDMLSWEHLIEKSAELLSPKGRFAVVLPYDKDGVFENLCWQEKLFLVRRCEVSTIEGQSPKRLLLEFSPERNETEHSILAIETPQHQRTTEYTAITSDFYL